MVFLLIILLVVFLLTYLLNKLQLIRYIVGKNIVDITSKNKMGFEAFQLLPREAQDFELLSRWLRFGTETSQELDSENNVEQHEGSQEVEVIRLLRIQTQ